MACLTRNSDFKERVVIPELIKDIEATKAQIMNSKHSADEALSQLDSINLQYFRYSRGQLQPLIVEMFSRLGLIVRFKINPENLKSFIRGISRHMKRVPYHNFTHAFNIVHMTYLILS